MEESTAQTAIKSAASVITTGFLVEALFGSISSIIRSFRSPLTTEQYDAIRDQMENGMMAERHGLRALQIMYYNKKFDGHNIQWEEIHKMNDAYRIANRSLGKDEGPLITNSEFYNQEPGDLDALLDERCGVLLAAIDEALDNFE